MLVHAEARIDEGGVRLLAKSIETLEDFLRNRKHSIFIYIDDTRSLTDIKEILQRSINGGGKIHFIVSTKQRMKVSISLQEGYMLDQDTLSSLSEMPGITKVVAG